MSFDNKFKSALKQAESLRANMISASQLSAIISLGALKKTSGLGLALEQAESLRANMMSASDLASITSTNTILPSLKKTSELSLGLEQAESFRAKKIIEEFKNLDMSEIILLYNEFNNTLKPYNDNINIFGSSIKWFNYKDIKQFIFDLMALYMFVVYFVYPSLEIKDLELINRKQQFWLQSELKKQTQELNNLVKVKNKGLYYVTVRDNIVLRTNPYIKKSTAKARLDKNVQLLILLRKDNWLNVEYFDKEHEITQIGWVHIKNLKRVRKY